MRFFQPILIAITVSITPVAAHAQQVLAEYFTLLSDADFYNSSGARLGSFGGVLQQDRANFHRFRLRDPQDQSDPYFSNKALRAGISEMYRRGPGAQQYIIDALLSGRPKYVLVRIIGSGGVPSYLEVYEGAG